MIEKLKKSLHENIVRITFTKVDGTERTLNATWKPEYTGLFDEDSYTTTKKKASANSNILRVYDITDGWRSFRLDSVNDWCIVK